MSDLRFFSDTSHALIEAEKRLAEIDAAAQRYRQECADIRAKHLPRGDRPSPAFYQATEGSNAVRIILGSR